MSTASLPPPDNEQVTSTSPLSSTSSPDSVSLSSPAAPKKGFLSSLFHHRKDDTPHSAHTPHTDTHTGDESSIAKATLVSASTPLPQPILTPDSQSFMGSSSSTADPAAAIPCGAAAAPTSASDAYSALIRSEDSNNSVPSSQVMTIAQLVNAAPAPPSAVARSVSPLSATSSTAASSTSTPTSVSVSRRSGFFTSLLGKADAEAHTNGSDAKESEDQRAAVVTVARTVVVAETHSRTRSNSDASVIDSKSIPQSSSATVPNSKSHSDLTGMSTPATSVPADSGTPNSRRRTLLNTLFKRKAGDESPTTSPSASPDTANPAHQQETASKEELAAIVVEAEQTRAAIGRVEAHTAKTASAMDQLKRMLDDSEAANGSRPRAASDSDERKPSVRLSSHAITVSKGGAEEQPKSARVEKKKGGFFSTLRLGKHKSEEEQHSEQEQKEEEDTPSPRSTPTTAASTTSSSSTLDYKARMQQLIERRGGGDRRRSMSDAHHSSDRGSLSQSNSTSQLKRSSAETNATMSENTALAARNVSLLQQVEHRASEMEDAAENMMAMARKIKEDAKKKSLFGW